MRGIAGIWAASCQPTRTPAKSAASFSIEEFDRADKLNSGGFQVFFVQLSRTGLLKYFNDFAMKHQLGGFQGS